MYLSRAELDPTRRETMVALISPQKFHGAVENAFPGARRRRLWRLDQLGEKLYLLLLSEERPDLTALCAQFGTGAPPETRPYDPLLERVTAGSCWQFRLTTQQLRGREGSRVRTAYRKAAKATGVKWNGRVYDPNDFSAGDLVNQALSAGTACLYGLAFAVITALGCAPGLGFVHVKHEGSFVYDIADLYKAEVVIPLAFEVAAQAPQDLPSVMRRRVRDAMVEHHILERMVHDVRWLLLNEEEQAAEPEAVYLWDSKIGTVANGVNYFDAEEGEEPSLS